MMSSMTSCLLTWRNKAKVDKLYYDVNLLSSDWIVINKLFLTYVEATGQSKILLLSVKEISTFRLYISNKLMYLV